MPTESKGCIATIIPDVLRSSVFVSWPAKHLLYDFSTRFIVATAVLGEEATQQFWYNIAMSSAHETYTNHHWSEVALKDDLVETLSLLICFEGEAPFPDAPQFHREKIRLHLEESTQRALSKFGNLDVANPSNPRSRV